MNQERDQLVHELIHEIETLVEKNVELRKENLELRNELNTMRKKESPTIGDPSTYTVDLETMHEGFIDSKAVFDANFSLYFGR